MTGWRLGFAMGPKWIIGAMKKLQSQSTSNPTSIVQKAAIAALNGPQECVEQMRGRIYSPARPRGRRPARDSRHEMREAGRSVLRLSQRLGISEAEGERASRPSADIAGRLLREAGVAVVPGEAFGTTEHVRISFPDDQGDIWTRVWNGCSKFFARSS